MGYMDMLGKFFKSNQNSVDSNNRNIGEKFYLKPHAEKDFFAWVNQWSVMVKKPSDLGFSDKGYDLPPLHTVKHMVHNDPVQPGAESASLRVVAGELGEELH